MSDIRAFIEARLAEREALLCDLAAQMANDGDNMRGGWNLWGDFGVAVNRLVNLHELADDIGAKRQILTWHVPEGFDGSTNPPGRTLCLNCATLNQHGQWCGRPYPCATVLALAHPFRSHPDFDPAWRIEP